MWCLLIWNEMVKWDRAEKVSKAVSEDTLGFGRQGTWLVVAWTVVQLGGRDGGFGRTVASLGMVDKDRTAHRATPTPSWH